MKTEHRGKGFYTFFLWNFEVIVWSLLYFFILFDKVTNIKYYEVVHL